MQYKVLFRKSVCSLFAFLIGWTQTGIAVAQMESIGKDANAFGREMADQEYTAHLGRCEHQYPGG